MSKVAVVYWSGTGNTEAMASAVSEGAKEKGARCPCSPPPNFQQIRSAIMTRLPSAALRWERKQLEESEFEPMFTACEGALHGKHIALFGSYGWGDGEWMRSWRSAAAVTEPALSARA